MANEKKYKLTVLVDPVVIRRAQALGKELDAMRGRGSGGLTSAVELGMRFAVELGAEEIIALGAAAEAAKKTDGQLAAELARSYVKRTAKTAR
jgi:predicted HTH domain antitoxin